MKFRPLIIVLVVIGFAVLAAYLQFLPSNRLPSKLQPEDPFYPLNINVPNIASSGHKVIFSYGYGLYEISDSDKSPKSLYKFMHPISKLAKIPGTENFLIQTVSGIGPNYTQYWYWHNGAPVKLTFPTTNAAFLQFMNFTDNLTTDSVVFTESPSEKILKFKIFDFKDSSVTELGGLGLGAYAHDIGDAEEPQLFTYSPDKTYILSLKTSQGGGLGTQAFIFDTARLIKVPFDFNWFISSAVWISNNEIFSFIDGMAYKYLFSGTLEAQKVALDNTKFKSINALSGITQRYVSPSKNFIAMVGTTKGKAGSNLSIYDLTKDTLIMVDDSNIKQSVSWSNDSKILLYSENEGDTTHVYLFDLEANSSSEIFRYPKSYIDGIMLNTTMFASNNIVVF